MKIDRLIAITMHLLNREIVSASALAGRFEVSKRTIQRDIEALNQAGIPMKEQLIGHGNYLFEEAYQATRRLLMLDERPTAGTPRLQRVNDGGSLTKPQRHAHSNTGGRIASRF